MKAYPAYKESGNGWIKNIPEHWNVLSLKRFSSLVNGSTPQSATNEYWDGDIVWITPTDLGGLNGKVISNSARRITEVGLNNCGASLTPKGSIILSTRAPIGHLALTDVQSCTNQGCKTIVPDLSRINNVYLYYYLFVFKEILQSLGQGSTFVELSSQNLKDFASVFPPLPEQQAVADFLDRKTAQIDTLIEKKQRQIDLLQEQRTALINHAVTKGLNPKVKMKDSGVEWLGEIPSHWDLLHLRRGVEFLTDFEANGSFSTIKDNVEVDIGEPYAWYVRATDLENERFGFDEGNRYCNEETYRFLTKTELFGGELLITKRGEIGKAYLMPKVDMPATLAPNLYLVRLNHKLHPPFAYHWFTSAGNSELVLADKSTTIGALYKEDVKNCRCLFPPINEQIEIAEYLQKIKQEFRVTIEKVYKEIELVQEYRTALISEAVTGKIDVRTAETVQTVHE